MQNNVKYLNKISHAGKILATCIATLPKTKISHIDIEDARSPCNLVKPKVYIINFYFCVSATATRETCKKIVSKSRNVLHYSKQAIKTMEEEKLNGIINKLKSLVP